MKPIYVENFVNEDLIKELVNNVAWVNEETRRKESFMADEKLEYRYSERENDAVYKSIEFHPKVKLIMSEINKLGYDLNVCFLNLYLDQNKALGWHSDDSHTIDQSQPIAVVSFGTEREIWWKPKGFKDNIDDNWKQKLGNGSLFIMPVGFQDEWLHKIPKYGKECGPRVSLTFRKFKN